MDSKAERKNFSFYMLADFSEKIDKIRQSDDKFKSMSRSQVLYYLISEIADSAKYSNAE